jgi:hypothetical protein
MMRVQVQEFILELGVPTNITVNVPQKNIDIRYVIANLWQNCRYILGLLLTVTNYISGQKEL